MPPVERPHIIRYGVWGAGREGISVANFLARRGHAVLVVDEREGVRPQALESSVRWRAGNHCLEGLRECDEVVLSPGIAKSHWFLPELAGVPLTTATNLWLATNSQKTIGVTGTKGKSTTATLIACVLSSPERSVAVAGNIGLPLTEIVEPQGVVVAELSSYQCAWLADSPRIAVITNLFQDHLPWHGSVEHYWRDKARLAEKAAILVCDAETLAKLTELRRSLPTDIRLAESRQLSDELVSTLPPSLRREHNLRNLKLALLAAEAHLGVRLEPSQIVEKLNAYRELDHRLQVVSDFGGLTWVDDTLSTNAQSLIAALEAFRDENLTVIVGGADRGISYAPLHDYLFALDRPVNFVCLPDNGIELLGQFASHNPLLIHPALDMNDAVRLAWATTVRGGVVLLSPGAASQNVFANFAEKSAAFLRAIEAQ